MWTIKEISEMTGISKETLRYYDQQGILKTKRTDNGYRSYDVLDLTILQNLIVLKYGGFTLEEIKVLTSLYTYEEGDECNEIANNLLDKRLKAMKRKVILLKEIIETIERIKPLFETHELYKLNQDVLSKEMQAIVEGIQEDYKFNK